MRQRFVRVERTNIAGEQHSSYQAVELRNGLIYALGDRHRVEAEAWLQIDDIERREKKQSAVRR